MQVEFLLIFFIFGLS